MPGNSVPQQINIFRKRRTLGQMTNSAQLPLKTMLNFFCYHE